MGTIDLAMIQAILPEILLLVLALLILALDLVIKPQARRNLGWVTAGGLGLIILIVLLVGSPGLKAETYWGGMIRRDWLGFLGTMLFLFGGAITALFARDQDDIGDHGEFYILMIVSIMGMCFLAISADLVMIYLSLETVAIPLYVLAGFILRSNKSVESGFKYVLFGAMTSTIALYGLSLLYGFTGTTNLYNLAAILYEKVPPVAVIGSLLLILVGFGFKISAVPLQFWAPDVYEGSPTPIAGFLSTASKAAGFVILTRFFLVAFPMYTTEWTAVISALSVATMTLGNLLALAQKNIKRLLAYSSIAQAGYMLIGLAALKELGVISLLYYIIAYTVTNLAAFGVVSVYGRIIGSDEIKDYAGMSRRAPGLAFVMLIAFLSLAGMPPLAGFVAKFLVFSAAVQAGLIWLAVIGVINSIIGLYYYLTVLKVAYLYRSDAEDQPAPITGAFKMALIVLSVGIILIGTLIAPWFSMSTSAAMSIGF